ncbi:MAG TPA: tRNA (adenosine(37)-N6)-threonylcarbamoyltransferase complex dimerization subunit type 1 TsaB [Thermomicrobiaceae bacterium]|nr:tRNA (adenosine(37)-N6)-threonylcarbamoyltransferase complex dimerization subunit type 1 TsaB [Thermomicrobiaceae bacterium]
MSAVEPLLLAIDTSTEVAGLALYDGDRISEVTWGAGRNQTVTLLGEVERMLSINGHHATDLRAVAVAMGPGTFNGLRVGMSVAKGLAFGLGLPLVGVVTLDVVAYPHARARVPIRAFVAAGRGRAVYADYRYRNGRWVRLSDMQNTVIEQLAEGLTERTILVGEVPADTAARLEEHALVSLPTPALRMRRPSYLAEIAYRRWQHGDVDRLEALEPVYVHGGTVAGTTSQSSQLRQ